MNDTEALITEVEELKVSLLEANALIFPNGVGEESTPQAVDRLRAENATLKKSGDELLKVAEMVIDISDKTPEDFDVDDVLTMVFAAAAAISKANRKKK